MTTASTTPSLSPAELSYIVDGLRGTPPTRSDGRGLLEPRDIGIEYGVAPAANGSSRVRIGNTEVVAGVKLEVGEPGPAKVAVDVTPQALPLLQSSALSALSTEYAAHLSEHFIPFVPSLPITKERAFLPSLHLTLVSADGNIITALALAARAAFADLEVPDTKVIAWTGDDDASSVADKSGFGALKDGAKGKGKGKARAKGLDDWDLGEGTHHIDGREDLPVLLSLNLVQDSENTFLDPTPSEEAACPERILAWFRPNGNVCGIRTEGGLGIDAGRIRGLLEQAQGLATAMAASLNADLP